jgi:hypothetical protein
VSDNVDIVIWPDDILVIWVTKLGVPQSCMLLPLIEDILYFRKSDFLFNGLNHHQTSSQGRALNLKSAQQAIRGWGVGAYLFPGRYSTNILQKAQQDKMPFRKYKLDVE